MDEIKIDLIDRRILTILSHDSRATYAEIAGELKLATATVHSRVNKLKENGVITGSQISVDLKKLGF